MPDSADPLETPDVPIRVNRPRAALHRFFLKSRPTAKRVVRIVAISFTASIGLLAIGFTTGWIASNSFTLKTSPSAAETPAVNQPIPGFDASTFMPDVRGITPDVAEQVLADAGIDVATVTKTTRAAAGQSGLVIAQTPAFGAGDPAVVSLIVSSPASVPNVIGQNATEAITLLNTFGGQIDRQPVYIPGAALGKVTTIDPAAGSPLPGIVTIRVTAAPATLNLATRDIDGSCSHASSIRMNGKDWTDAVSCRSSGTGMVAEWLLDKRVEDVTGTLGIVDSAGSGASAVVQIFADGKVIGTYPVAYGTSVPFTVTTRGAITLTLQTQSTSGDTPDVVVGDFTARGSAAEIATLTGP